MFWLIWLGTSVGAGVTGAALVRAGFGLWAAVAAGFCWYVVERVLEDAIIAAPQRRAFILQTLATRGWLHGLDLVQASDGLLRRGTVYVDLSRLENAELVTSWVDPADESGRRRVYAITDAGRWWLLVEKVKRS